MRSLIAGVNDVGNSCILKEVLVEERDIHASGPSHRTDVFQLTESPPPPRPAARTIYRELGIAPGHLAYLVLQMPANIEHPMHYTDTLNFHVVVAGSLEVLLDDGAHQLDLGDSLVLPGIDHGWRAGPSGCVMTIVNLGSTRP